MGAMVGTGPHVREGRLEHRPRAHRRARDEQPPSLFALVRSSARPQEEEDAGDHLQCAPLTAQ